MGNSIKRPVLTMVLSNGFKVIDSVRFALKSIPAEAMVS
jgi:hypothetical protein